VRAQKAARDKALRRLDEQDGDIKRAVTRVNQRVGEMLHARYQRALIAIDILIELLITADPDVLVAVDGRDGGSPTPRRPTV
jgi:hypothetical protein